MGTAGSSSPPTTSYVSVEGVSADICGRCIRAAADAGWDLRAELRTALRKAVRSLPGVSTYIRVRWADRSKPHASGFARRGSGEIVLRLRFGQALAKARANLPLLVAHELHHAQRFTKGPGYGATLIEDLVAEGLADAFALEIYPEVPEWAWVRRLDRETLMRLWRRARRVSDRPYSQGRYRRWFVTGEPLPAGVGYALGFAIVDRYLERHPGARASDLALVAADEIVEGSGLPT